MFLGLIILKRCFSPVLNLFIYKIKCFCTRWLFKNLTLLYNKMGKIHLKTEKYFRQSIIFFFFLVNNCEFSSHHCINLKRCTYFEDFYQTDVDALTVSNVLQKLFCGFDGYDIMVCAIWKKNLISTKNA